MTVPRWAGTSCSPRGPGWAARAARATRSSACSDSAISRTRSPCRAPGNGRPVSTQEGRHESSKVRAVVTTTRPLIRWPPQLAASQIRAAARIAKKNTTTMTAAGIVRSLWSCLCTSVPLAVDGAGHGAADESGAAALGGFGCPRQRLQLPNLRLFDPARPGRDALAGPAGGPEGHLWLRTLLALASDTTQLTSAAPYAPARAAADDHRLARPQGRSQRRRDQPDRIGAPS